MYRQCLLIARLQLPCTTESICRMDVGDDYMELIDNQARPAKWYKVPLIFEVQRA